MRATVKLPTTSYALLGMLATSPMSGYDLVQAVGRSIAHFWPISASQIYSELPRLEGLGLLEGDDVHQERLPDKRVYRITGRGEALLDEWLSSPDYEPDRIRIGVLVKVFFGHRMPRERTLDLVGRYRAEAKEDRDHVASIVSLLADVPEAAGARATALLGQRICEAIIAWADEVAASLPEADHEHTPEEIAEGARKLLETTPPRKRRTS